MIKEAIMFSFWISGQAVLFAPWFIHIIWAISTVSPGAGGTAGQLALGLIGALIPPIGWVHGVMIWAGI